MADFKTAYKITAQIEGGYAHDVDDPGGETWKGVARNYWPRWKGWVIIDTMRKDRSFPANLAKSAQLEQLVQDFYQAEFWDRLSLSLVQNQALGNKLYDMAVNLGQPAAGEMLQRVLNVANKNGQYYKDLTVDGKVGPATIAALNSHPRPVVIFKGINCLQGARYIENAEKSPAKEKYLNGWLEQRITDMAF